ncbi:opioid growth factor receptor-related protein [Leptolyngbya sp. AN03gr2]|uniref:opioid growth factor receptor-related protein n=1 Tax=unclassified Leptolyngbya TaxID=2650499 RepID=UPI003D31747D
MSQTNRSTNRLVPFYLGEQRDIEGRTIEEILAWDFEELECVHNYIQWLFPLAERSAFNSDAPIVTSETIEAFRSNPQLRQNLVRSLQVMLRFYGLQEDNGEITRSEEYPIRKSEWIGRFNHNYLRITRILKCLMAFGLEQYAQAFYRCLEQIYREESNRIGSETFHYWTNAVNP